MKSFIPVLLTTLLACSGCATGPDVRVRDAGPRVVCFFGGGEWRFERMTHFIPGFLAFGGDGSISRWDLRETVQQARAAGVKVIVSFDGQHWQENFLPMSDNDDGSRDRFIANILQYCLDNGIDGVDYDWEIGGGFNAKQQRLYSDLVIETKRAFAPHDLTVSIDAYFRDEIDARAIEAVDWIQLMAYRDMDELRAMIEYWNARGATADKLVLGMAIGWGHSGEGFDRDLVGEKARRCLDGGFGGVMLFRTDLDTQDGDSMLQIVHDTLHAE